MKDNIKKESNTLLLVDDDPNLILLVTDYLKLQGYRVLTAENGIQALEIIEIITPDLILCDIIMPEMDGYSLVSKIRSDLEKQWIPVIFLSAKGQSNDRIRGLEIGADVYVVKPFEPDELVAQIRSSLSQTERLMHYSKRSTASRDPLFELSKNIELTQTELKVIQLLAQGLPNKEIAERLNVGQRTIESHVSNMLSKTSLTNRTELARWAVLKNLA